MIGQQATYNGDPEHGVYSPPVLRLRDCSEDVHHILMAMYRRRCVRVHSIIFQSAASCQLRQKPGAQPFSSIVCLGEIDKILPGPPISLPRSH
jgi:hypothetical protein